MKLMSRFCLTLVAGGLVALQATAKIDLKRVTPVPDDKPVPIEDYFRPRLLAQPKMNPSGTRVASLITATEDQHLLMIYELDTQKSDTLAPMRDKDIRSVDWVSDSRVIFTISKEKYWGLGLLAGEFGKLGRSWVLLQFLGTRVISIPPGNRLQPLVWNQFDFESVHERGAEIIDTNDYGAKLLDALHVNTTSQDIRAARDSNLRRIRDSFPLPNLGLSYGYMADREGQLAYAFTSDNGALSLLRLEGKEWLRCSIDLEFTRVYGPGDAPGLIVGFTLGNDGKPGILSSVNAATGETVEPIYQDDAYDFTGSLVRHRATNQIIGIRFNRDFPKTIWFTNARRQVQEALNSSFPGQIVEIIDSNETEDRFLFMTYSDRQPAIFSWVDMKKGSAGLFKASAPWIDPKRMRPMSVFKFKTRDDHRLDAYLTLPEGATKENPAPLIVMPHGGPYVRDTWGFSGEVQFLASRGYAVLQPNYRGSTGYDWMFPDEDRWDYLKMHDDVTDATHAAIRTGLVDSDRVAIMGGSFGGYLALQGVVREPDLYRCAVTNAGVFDWERQLRDEKFNRFDDPTYGRMLVKLGDPKKEAAKFDAISPGRHTDKIRVPVFVAGGKDDPVVEITQSKALISELKKNNVTYESYLVAEEGHGMAFLENEVKLYTRIEAFLAKHMAPRAGP
jgi:acetyl esterase/lipase